MAEQRAAVIAEAQRSVLVAARAWRELVGDARREGGTAVELAAAARVLVGAVDWLEGLEVLDRAERGG